MAYAGVLDLAAPILAEGETLEGFLAGDDGFDAEKVAEAATASSASSTWPSSTSLADRVGGAPPAPAAGVDPRHSPARSSPTARRADWSAAASRHTPGKGVRHHAPTAGAAAGPTRQCVMACGHPYPTPARPDFASIGDEAHVVVVHPDLR
jgi:hypothetical protein